MRRGSIATTLLWLSAGWLVIALVATAFLLTELYSRALDTGLSETLEFQIESLVGAALENGPADIPSTAITDPRFARLASGWYWEIRDQKGEVVSSSASRVGSILPRISTPFGPDNRRTAVLTDDYGTTIRAIERRITLQDAGTLDIMVTGNLNEIYAQVADFRGQTLVVLGAVGAMLAVMSFLVARFALRPIMRLRQSVEAVREGEAAEIGGAFPSEIAPLADEINQLLRSNAQIIERARNQVGNLAHGLKTPLAVLRNEAAGKKTALADIVRSESDKMASLVANYLDRARLAARTSIIGKKADAPAVMERLVRVMGQVHSETEVRFTPPSAGTPWFRGEESDLEEIAGNLLDNACKWSRTGVEVSLGPDNSAAAVTALRIVIEDDGPGLEQDEIALALRRGQRLDEKTPGSGLGLDIVKELVDIYGGSIKLGRSRQGGLRAEVILPGVRPRAD